MTAHGPEGCEGWVPVRDGGEDLRWRPVTREGREWCTYRALPRGGWTPAERVRDYHPFPRGAGAVDVEGGAVLEIPATGPDVDALAMLPPEELPGAELPPELLRDVDAFASLWSVPERELPPTPETRDAAPPPADPPPPEALPQVDPAPSPMAPPPAPYVPPVVSVPPFIRPAPSRARWTGRRELPDDARAIRTALCDPAAVAEQLGLLQGPPGHGKRAQWYRTAAGVIVRCPAHDEHTPSCSLSRGPDGTLRVRCFGCGWSADVLGLLGAVYALDVRREFPRVLELGAELAGVRIGAAPRAAPPRRPPPAPAPDAGPDVDVNAVWRALATAAPLDAAPDVVAYLDARSILAGARADGWCALPADARGRAAVREAIVAAVGVEGWNACGLAHPRDPFAWAYGSTHRVCIPWRELGGAVGWFQRRAIGPVEGPKYIAPRDAPSPTAPYGAEQLGGAPARPVAVVEGAVDALSLRAQLGPEGDAPVVLGAPGVTGWRPAWCAYLDGRAVAIAYDADDAGDRGAEQLGELLAGVALAVERWRPRAPAKDWNDALTTDRRTA